MRSLAEEHGLTDAFVSSENAAEAESMRALGYQLACYDWNPADGIARLTYEREIDGIREREEVRQLHGLCYVPPEILKKL